MRLFLFFSKEKKMMVQRLARYPFTTTSFLSTICIDGYYEIALVKEGEITILEQFEDELTALRYHFIYIGVVEEYLYNYL